MSCLTAVGRRSAKSLNTRAGENPPPKRTTVRRVRVWLEEWEWQCCGEPFAVGSEVEWGLLPMSGESRSYLKDPLGTDVVAEITHREAHHEGEDDKQPLP